MHVHIHNELRCDPRLVKLFLNKQTNKDTNTYKYIQTEKQPNKVGKDGRRLIKK